jgi:hypothetical protein
MRAFLIIAAAIGVLYFAVRSSSGPDSTPANSTTTNASAESYWLVHAIGNAEKVVAKGLTLSECKSRKTEYTKAAEALGVHSESQGIGSITCLPASDFEGAD